MKLFEKWISRKNVILALFLNMQVTTGTQILLTSLAHILFECIHTEFSIRRVRQRFQQYFSPRDYPYKYIHDPFNMGHIEFDHNLF